MCKKIRGINQIEVAQTPCAFNIKAMFVTTTLCIIVLGLLFHIFYKWATRNQNYFVQRKVKHLKPNFLFGNTLKLYLNRSPSHIFIDDIYNSYPNEKLIGFFDFQKPTYMACDIGLINQIGIKQFENFVDRATSSDLKPGVLYGRSIVFMRGDEWRAMRLTLSPAFTRNKLRNVFQLANTAAEKLVQNLYKNLKENNDRVRMEMAHLFADYTADITASYTFGLEIDSCENKRNEFITNAADGIDFSGLKSGLRFILLVMLPNLMKAIDFDLVPQRIKTFFRSIVLDVMDQRTEKRIYRPDLIHTLMEVRNKRGTSADGGEGAGYHWTDEELVAQLFFICVSSIEPIASISAFMAYELAIDPNIQQKLYDEIRTVVESLDGQQLTFDALVQLKYLDQVIQETLRKYPATSVTMRNCTKDTELDLGDGRKLNIEAGASIWIPIGSVQMDPKNFVDPMTFDPERFNAANKPKIKAGSYIPFGVGPRICIGQTYVSMVFKILFVNLLLNFRIQSYKATQIPLEFGNTVFLYKSKSGVHLELKPRTPSNARGFESEE